MTPETRITSAPSPSQPTNAAPEANSSVPNRMTPTETIACDQAIVQQRQQTLSNPNPPPRLVNQRRLPLTPLGYELATSPRGGRENPSRRSPLSTGQPNPPDPALKTALNLTSEPFLASENRAPSLEDKPQ